MKPILPSGSSARGAQMGRSNILPTNINEPIKLRMEKLRWVDGDYDQFGAYWGAGNDIYCAYAYVNEPIDYDFSVCIFVRAPHRTAAKMLVRDKMPEVIFYK